MTCLYEDDRHVQDSQPESPGEELSTEDGPTLGSIVEPLVFGMALRESEDGLRKIRIYLVKLTDEVRRRDRAFVRNKFLDFMLTLPTTSSLESRIAPHRLSPTNSHVILNASSSLNTSMVGGGCTLWS